MKFESALWTDIGVERETNQDSMCLKHALTDQGEVVMGVVCDGMGGLANGELASAEVVRAFSGWFEKELPQLLKMADCEEEICYRWERLIQEQNQNIVSYGRSRGTQLGTTATAMIFLPGGRYILAHVGDTRAYRITQWSAEQLTVDHSLAEQRFRAGELTRAEAEQHMDRNVLVRSVGALRTVKPDVSRGRAAAGECYLLCTDGFRHEITEDELFRSFAPDAVRDEAELSSVLERMTRLNIERGETDNISALAIRLR